MVLKFANLLLLGALGVPALFAAPYATELRPASTKIEWTLGSVLHTVHGTFELKRGAVVFDPAAGSASGEIVVDVASGRSGNDSRDRRMQTQVLESAKFPEAVFTPVQIEGRLILNASSHIRIRGTFQIHGATHDMTLDATVRSDAEAIDADLTFDIPYVAWGMNDPGTLILRVGKTVHVSVHTSGSLIRH
jgi:polyisoprenoid-binding protein YceI